MPAPYEKSKKVQEEKKMGSMPRVISILNGCNLNALGKREPRIYGKKTLAEIKEECEKWASEKDFRIDFRQSNHEGDLINWIYEAAEKSSGILLNAGAYAHTSIGLQDAIRSNHPFPVIEVHCSNIYARETFRRQSMISSVSAGLICGFGYFSYILALEAIIKMLHSNSSNPERNENV